MKHVHPVYILKQLWRFWFIILLPFFQGLFSGNLEFTFYNTAPTAVLLIGTFWEWLKFQYQVLDDKIILRKGIFFHQEKRLLKEKISTADIDTGFLLTILRGTEIRIDTESGSGKHPDLHFTVWKKDGDKILRYFCGNQLEWKYRAPTLKTAAGALAFSRSAPGLLLLSAIIKAGGQFLGKGFQDKVYGTVTTAQKLLGQYIPPVFAGIAYLIAAGWLFSFLFLTLRQMNFHLGRAGKYLVTRKGFLVRRYSIVAAPMVNARILQQTPLMRLMGLTQVLLDCAGYGKEQGELALLVPAERPARALAICADVYPEIKGEPIVFHPPKDARMRYLAPALWWGGGLLALEALLLFFLGNQAGFPTLLVAIPFIYCVIFAVQRWNARKEAGISANYLTGVSYKGLSVLWVTFAKPYLQGVTGEQNPFQQWQGLCHLYLYPRSEGRFRVKIKHLQSEDFPELFPPSLPPPLHDRRKKTKQ